MAHLAAIAGGADHQVDHFYREVGFHMLSNIDIAGGGRFSTSTACVAVFNGLIQQNLL